jgi:acyl dehydratase
MPTLAKLFADAEVGIDLAGLIHAEQSFEWPVPPHAGDVVDAVAEIASVEGRPGLTLVTVRLGASDAAGHAVCRGSARFLVRGGREERPAPAEPSRPPGERSPE